MAAALIRFRVDLGPELAIGPGKIELLEQVGTSGSLSQAARALGMSYRRAWQLLDSLNAALLEPVTEARKGGSHGGGSQLTEFGREVIRIYRAFDGETQRRAERVFRPIRARARHGRRRAAAAPVLRLSER
ncbi:MAG: LysR family transcriptional regulator [Proteobacteria bacterium]|nr:LysR family transcriptional regulator [Pseudomonadota bacterium]